MVFSCARVSRFHVSGGSSMCHRRPGLMRAYLPIATDGGEPIEEVVRSDLVVRQPAFGHSLGDRGHISCAVVTIPETP